MLSRVAENIYWMTRYVERAENTARLIRVNTMLMMDTPRGVNPGWEPLVTIVGVDAQFKDAYTDPSERNIVKFLIGDTGNPGSIVASLTAARENCRTVREIVPRSTWEALNELYLYARDHAQQGITKKGRDAYLDEIIRGSQRLVGLTGSVMYRDAAYNFARIGRNLERADMTTRILDVRSTDLFDETLDESLSLDALQWISVLRSLSAYQSYRRHMQIRVSRSAVLAYLLLDPLFPRSVLHCIDAVEECIAPMNTGEATLKAIRSLYKKLKSCKTEGMTQEALHALIDDVQLKIIRIHKAIESSYFLTAHQQQQSQA